MNKFHRRITAHHRQPQPWINWLQLAICSGLLLGYLSVIYDRVFERIEQPTDAFIEPACSIDRVEHQGRVYAVRTIRTKTRRVCLIDHELNPGGCMHLSCEK